jgi:hypothetical protein
MIYFFKRIAPIYIALCMFSEPTLAQLAPTQAPPTKLLSDAEVKAKYQNCEGGWYSGPRPGKTRYAKDPFLWVVTPDFAKRFCMPPEFVSADLKGAEAVAFRIVKKPDDEYCGFGGNAEACSAPVELRFEVYIKRDVKLPKAHEGRRYEGINFPSSKLISKTPAERKLTGEIARRDTNSAWLPHFPGQLVGLEGVKDGKVAWPIVALYEESHFGGVFGDIDYYAFEGSTGFFENPGIKQNHVTRFFITFARPERDKSKPRTGQSLSEYAHYIELPEAFTNKIAEADRTRGTNVRALLKDAFGSVPGSTAPMTPAKP